MVVAVSDQKVPLPAPLTGGASREEEVNAPRVTASRGRVAGVPCLRAGRPRVDGSRGAARGPPLRPPPIGLPLSGVERPAGVIPLLVGGWRCDWGLQRAFADYEQSNLTNLVSTRYSVTIIRSATLYALVYLLCATRHTER